MTNVMSDSKAEVAAPPSKVPQRDLLDRVATNDVVSILTLMMRKNVFDQSPGMKLIVAQRPRFGMQRSTLVPDMEAMESTDATDIPRVRDANGNGVVHLAAAHGHSVLLGVLVNDCGCAVDEPNSAGMTPLHLAAYHGHVDCVRVLKFSGAEPLSPTRCTAPLATGHSTSLAGRSALFLAHCRQQLAVLQFLLPEYRQLIESMCEERTPPKVWAAAAAEPDMGLFFLLLDMLECTGTTSGALPIALGFDLDDALRQALPEVLGEVIPSTRPMAVEQQLVLDRLAHLGFIKRTTLVSSSETLLGHVLSTAQPLAWRVLVWHGLIQPHKCDPAAVRDGGYRGSGEVELRLLIEEAISFSAYQSARKTYLLKGDSAKRRATLLSRRQTWKEILGRLQNGGFEVCRSS